ncbi:hypothetical protein BDZ94DRAFT_1243520 [Collybia nuda]|uniref:DUF7330 domain-containing protein n=1 Tax=Collybia nuda TaxID=64659 RepID=A0A9P5YLA9_9AGAR|nr:hypothetical protein BDZ94DRAFT_1243520 [Collybia nuda]
MIILDEEDQRRAKQAPYTAGPTLRFPEKAAGRSDSPLPDYETSEARQQLILKHSNQRKIDPKLWRAILYALAIYVTLSVAIGVPIIVLKKPKSTEVVVPDPSIWGSDDSDSGTPLSLANVDTWTLDKDAHCGWTNIQDDPSHYTFTARSQYNLSHTGSVFIRSNVSLITDKKNFIEAKLSVDINPDSKATNILFDVNITASTSGLLRSTGPCFSDKGNNRGLYIYSSRRLSSMDALWLEIRLLFPQESSNQILENFVTYLPSFSQTFGNLTGDAAFNNVLIEGSGRDIICQSMKAPKIAIKNSYGSIRGVFRASESLNLDSIKGSIITNVTLASDPKRTTPTYLTLDTGDGEIDARVTLLAPDSWFTGRPTHPRAFVADVKTFNGPLKLKVANSASTPPVPLQLSVQNNLANTSVTLDPCYEGTFSAQTKLSQVFVRERFIGPWLDPLQQSRQMSTIYYQNESTRVRGWIGWGKQPTYGDGIIQGQVKIISSLSPVMLQLSGT